MIKEATLSLSKKENLSFADAEAVMDEILSGQASPMQMGAYLTALSLKGESADELAASASGILKRCVRLLHGADALEIVGTGGRQAMFNLSTAAAIITAAAGVPVAKHGARNASNQCGAADVLEALGVNVAIPEEKSLELLESISLCFLYTQNEHMTNRYFAPVRRELAVRTVFDVLGPLTCSAGARIEMIGVSDRELLDPLARTMCGLDLKNAMLVCGEDGTDNVSLCAPTEVREIRDGKMHAYTITPEQFGLERCDVADLQGGAPPENAEIIEAVLNGRKGPKRNAAVLNAAAALYLSGRCNSMASGVKAAEDTIDSGAAMGKLEQFIRSTH